MFDCLSSSHNNKLVSQCALLHYYTGSDEVVLKVPRQGTPAPQLIMPLIVMLTRRSVKSHRIYFHPAAWPARHGAKHGGSTVARAGPNKATPNKAVQRGKETLLKINGGWLLAFSCMITSFTKGNQLQGLLVVAFSCLITEAVGISLA